MTITSIVATTLIWTEGLIIAILAGRVWTLTRHIHQAEEERARAVAIAARRNPEGVERLRHELIADQLADRRRAHSHYTRGAGA